MKQICKKYLLDNYTFLNNAEKVISNDKNTNEAYFDIMNELCKFKAIPDFEKYSQMIELDNKVVIYYTLI